jgi:hypothetical protein
VGRGIMIGGLFLRSLQDRDYLKIFVRKFVTPNLGLIAFTIEF